MTTFKLAYIKRMTDRHDHVRHYYNRKGYAKVALPGAPGSKEFMAAYNAVHTGTPAKVQPGAGRVKPGTVAELLVRYYQSTDFGDLKPQTQKNYRYLLERFRDMKLGGMDTTCGENLVKNFRRGHIAAIMDSLQDTPGAARSLRNRVRTLFRYAIYAEYRDDNPVAEVRVAKPKSREGHIPWSDADIEAFKKVWSPFVNPEVDPRPYIAMMILLRTAVRRSDAHRLGRQHLVTTDMGDELQFRSVKGDIEMAIPVDGELKAALELVPKNQMVFIHTEYGKPFSAAGFTSWFVERAKMAGLVKRTPHGLRKAADRHLAESGNSAHEIMAIDGHQTLAEVERYTRSANRRGLAWSAVGKREKAKK